MASSLSSDFERAGDRISLIDRSYRWTTVGLVALLSLTAFESLAVTTIMPTITAQLDGRAWFAAAFSATIAASVVGMVLGGEWSDASGPRTPLIGAVACLIVGSVAAGWAPDIAAFVAARFIQGLGSGATLVLLYVIAGRVYAAKDLPHLFAMFAAAWLLPSMVGPVLAGFVAGTMGWRWVFLGLAMLTLLAGLPLIRTTQTLSEETQLSRRRRPRRIVASGVVASALVALNVSADASAHPRVSMLIVLLVVVAVAASAILPPGTFAARRGLPSLILLRGLAGGSFFAAEAYLPYFLQSERHAAAWSSGLVLIAGAVGWTAASATMAKVGPSLRLTTTLGLGTAIFVCGLMCELMVLAFDLPSPTVAAAWLVAAAGIGLVYPRISSAVLSPGQTHPSGEVSTAMAASDAVLASAALAVAGAVFGSVAHASPGPEPFVRVLAFTTVLALAGIPVAYRAGDR